MTDYDYPDGNSWEDDGLAPAKGCVFAILFFAMFIILTGGLWVLFNWWSLIPVFVIAAVCVMVGFEIISGR